MIVFITETQFEVILSAIETEIDLRRNLKLESVPVLEELKIDLLEQYADNKIKGYKEKEFLDAFGGLDMMKYDIKMRKAMDALKGE